MRLSDIVSVKRIKVPLDQSTGEGAIAELVDVLAANGDLLDRDKVLQAVLDREKTRTTGIGSGLAIPHGKTSGVKQLVMAVGRADTPMDFQSIDGKPVSLVVLLVSPMDQTGQHIQALARVSRLMSMDSFRSRLLSAPGAQEIFDAIKDQEKQEDSAA